MAGFDLRQAQPSKNDDGASAVLHCSAPGAKTEARPLPPIKSSNLSGHSYFLEVNRRTQICTIKARDQRYFAGKLSDGVRVLWANRLRGSWCMSALAWIVLQNSFWTTDDKFLGPGLDRTRASGAHYRPPGPSWNCGRVSACRCRGIKCSLLCRIYDRVRPGARRAIQLIDVGVAFVRQQPALVVPSAKIRIFFPSKLPPKTANT